MSAKLVQRPPSAERIIKYMKNGIAIGVTKTAKEAQAAVVANLRGTFTIRNAWLTNSPIGIKVTIARGDQYRPTATIYTTAKFLPMHEAGATKFPLGNHIAVPTKFARPNKGSRIRAEHRPKALIASGKAAIVENDNGTKLLYADLGGAKGWVPMYVLTPKAKQKKADIWEKPIRKVVDRNLAKNIDAGVATTMARLKARS